MSNRYFSDSPVSAGPTVLTGSEAHHLIHVMRATDGLRVVLFDGSGAEFPAVVQRVGRNKVELTVLAREEVDRELPFDLTLGVALPKGDRQKWLVEKVVELGVKQLVPLQTERAVAQPEQQSLMRLRRAVIEASKQCGRNRLMEIAEPQSWSHFVDAGAATSCRLLAQPKLSPLPLGEGLGVRELWAAPQDAEPTHENRLLTSPLAAAEGALLAVGPEGGFSPAEVQLAVTAGWHTVDLGPRILRVETAALVLVSMVVEQVSVGLAHRA